MATDCQTSHEEYDVIIVGAGFSGISSLHRLRKAGLRAHIFEAGSDFGGVWYWNRYPGARVDSETPFYQLNIPEVYNTWSFSQRFPDHRELRKYLAHIDKTLELRKDVSFDARVNGCTWDQEATQWIVRTENGKVARARWLILATGLLHRTHLPNWPGQQKYQGVIRHSGEWPEETSVKGKKVAVIGAGATSVQIVQELAKEASHLTVLMRRPSYCLPMGQRDWSEEEQTAWRAYYHALFAAGRNSAVGFPSVRHDVRVQDVSPEEREKYFEGVWAGGGFHFMLRNYNNVMIDKEANKIVYDFWKKKVRQRLIDPVKQEQMAPDTMPYYFNTKRTPLEHDYYDVLNQPNVEIVNVIDHPIESFTEHGLQLGNEAEARDFDYIVCATGFDSFTGSLTNMGLTSKHGVDIKDVWANGVRTYLGMMFAGFPNAFMVYSPQSPTALSNGPTIIECQCDFVCDTIQSLHAQGPRTTIEPTKEAEDKWKVGMDAAIKHTLFPYTDSWWNTSNIPGKKKENQTYVLGINHYEKQCREMMVGWKGFEIGGGEGGVV
ncbi:FAD/NAD(P)-binding domain-containing protein [Plenodomus tracheiphilus IPT5]|uniref:FAD/NAD(P)-binding domain-containing protein n=1 Tax=Plenodomus tracheiphilus IPT5 TaxID=1408161 RepID=A0A6A7AQU4_9PLEO|nr:FAD/NAD(P)-binding domain-containing protein [Plenodomus tracheiphilus IPT5]